MTFDGNYVIKTVETVIFPVCVFIVVVKDSFYKSPFFITAMGREFADEDGIPFNVGGTTGNVAVTCSKPMNMVVSTYKTEDGLVLDNTRKGICIIIPEGNVTTDTVVHESMHVAMCLCDSMGIDVHDQEIVAYLTQFVVRQVADFIQEDKHYKKTHV